MCWNNTGIGHLNTGLIYHDGGIQLKMTGEACRLGGSNSSVTVEFLCEMDINVQDHNKILLKENVSCKVSVQYSIQAY